MPEDVLNKCLKVIFRILDWNIWKFQYIYIYIYIYLFINNNLFFMIFPYIIVTIEL